MVEDSEIIELYWQRDDRAIVQTDTAYGARLQGLSNHILGNREDAQECVNDTYLRTWNAIPPERPNYFYAFLAKICRFVSLGKLDWNHAAKRKADIVTLTAEMEMCIPDNRMQQRLEAEELGMLLSRFLKGQSEDNRLIFMRRYWHMDSVEEIAARYGFSQSKVKTQLHRTRTKLRHFLESEGISV